MKYNGYYVYTCPDSGIERFNEKTGETDICTGFYCQVFEDENCENQIDDFCLAVGYEIPDDSDESLGKGIRAYLSQSYIPKTPTEERQREENETAEMILAEDAVETTAYLANAPACCSGAEQLDHVLGMLGANVMDEDIYHSEDDHPKMSM